MLITEQHNSNFPKNTESKALLTVFFSGMCTFRYVDFQLEERSVLDAFINCKIDPVSKQKTIKHIQCMESVPFKMFLYNGREPLTATDLSLVTVLQ